MMCAEGISPRPQILPDQSVLAGGVVPGQGVYEVSGVASLVGITEIRLEVLKDPSLPAGGPGFAANGNFVLTELQLAAAPVPESASTPRIPRSSLMIKGGRMAECP